MGPQPSVAGAEGTISCVRGGGCYWGFTTCHWRDPVQGLGLDVVSTLHEGNGSFVQCHM